MSTTSTRIHLHNFPILGSVDVDVPDDEWRAIATFPWPGELSDQDHELIEQVVRDLDGHSIHNQRILQVLFTVTAPTLRAAALAAYSAAADARRKHDLPALSGISVQTSLSYFEEVSRPHAIVLLSQADVAKELGVSAQRVSQLARENRNFPKPFGEPSTGRVWTKDSIEAFAARRPRDADGKAAVGRPAKSRGVVIADA